MPIVVLAILVFPVLLVFLVFLCPLAFLAVHCIPAGHDGTVQSHCFVLPHVLPRDLLFVLTLDVLSLFVLVAFYLLLVSFSSSLCSCLLIWASFNHVIPLFPFMLLPHCQIKLLYSFIHLSICIWVPTVPLVIWSKDHIISPAELIMLECAKECYIVHFGHQWRQFDTAYVQTKLFCFSTDGQTVVLMVKYAVCGWF